MPTTDFRVWIRKTCMQIFMLQQVLIYIYFLKIWWHAATLFIYFDINRADIQYLIFHIFYSLNTALVVLIAFRSVEGLLWGAVSRFKLGPAVQEAATIWATPHPNMSHAAP